MEGRYLNRSRRGSVDRSIRCLLFRSKATLRTTLTKAMRSGNRGCAFLRCCNGPAAATPVVNRHSCWPLEDTSLSFQQRSIGDRLRGIDTNLLRRSSTSFETSFYFELCCIDSRKLMLEVSSIVRAAWPRRRSWRTGSIGRFGRRFGQSMGIVVNPFGHHVASCRSNLFASRSQ
jgi:hypothetical protein